jgi:hypothetical protein
MAPPLPITGGEFDCWIFGEEQEAADACAADKNNKGDTRTTRTGKDDKTQLGQAP